MPDVVVVGAGPVGGVIAALLQKHGVETAVYESRAEVSTRPRAVGIHPPAVAVLRGLGLELRGARQISRGQARDRRGVLGSLAFDPPVLTLPQHELQAEIAERLSHVRRSSTVLGIDTRAGSSPRVLLAAGTIPARLVIAADGVASGIRSQLGIPWRRRPGRARYLMADVDDDPRHELGDDAALWFTHGGVVESFPLPNSRRRWVARAAGGTDLERCIAERTGLRAPAGTNSVTTSFLASQHLAQRWVAGDVVLLGDAAHEISPIGGQGMNLGILDAAALAPAIVEALGGNDAALGAWERARRRSARVAMAQAAFNMAVGAPAPPIVQPIKSVGVRTLARGPIARRLETAFTMSRL